MSKIEIEHRSLSNLNVALQRFEQYCVHLPTHAQPQLKAILAYTTHMVQNTDTMNMEHTATFDYSELAVHIKGLYAIIAQAIHFQHLAEAENDESKARFLKSLDISYEALVAVLDKPLFIKLIKKLAIDPVKKADGNDRGNIALQILTGLWPMSEEQAQMLCNEINQLPALIDNEQELIKQTRITALLGAYASNLDLRIHARGKEPVRLLSAATSSSKIEVPALGLSDTQTDGLLGQIQEILLACPGLTHEDSAIRSIGEYLEARSAADDRYFNYLKQARAILELPRTINPRYRSSMKFRLLHNLLAEKNVATLDVMAKAQAICEDFSDPDTVTTALIRLFKKARKELPGKHDQIIHLLKQPEFSKVKQMLNRPLSRFASRHWRYDPYAPNYWLRAYNGFIAFITCKAFSKKKSPFTKVSTTPEDLYLPDNHIPVSLPSTPSSTSTASSFESQSIAGSIEEPQNAVKKPKAVEIKPVSPVKTKPAARRNNQRFQRYFCMASVFTRQALQQPNLIMSN